MKGIGNVVAFFYTSTIFDDTEHALDFADELAKSDPTRLSNNDIFGGLARKLNFPNNITLKAFEEGKVLLYNPVAESYSNIVDLRLALEV